MQVDVFKMSRVELLNRKNRWVTCSLTVYLKGLNWDFIYIYCTIHRQRTCLQSNNQLSCNFLLFYFIFYPPIISCHPIGQWKDLLFYYFSCVLFRCRLKSFFFSFWEAIKSSQVALHHCLHFLPHLNVACRLHLLLFCCCFASTHRCQAFLCVCSCWLQSGT